MKENTDNSQDRRDAGILDSVGRDGPFSAPDGYFDSLESRVKSLIAAEEDPQPEWLNQVGRKHVFQVPDNYFEELETRFSERKSAVSPQPSSRSKIVSLKQMYGLGAVAAIVLLLMFFFRPDSVKQEMLTNELASLEEVPMEALIAAVEAEDLSLDMILSSIEQDPLTE